MLPLSFLRRLLPLSPAQLLGLLIVLGSAALAVSGCVSPLNTFIAAAYLIGGPPSIGPDFDFETGESFTDKDVTVAVVCFAPKDVRYNFTGIDYELSKYVSNQLFQKKIQVVNPDRIHDWLDRNANWDRPTEIGAAFKTTYVVEIELADFTLYEKDSVNLYRGQAEAMVTVWKMNEDKEDGEQIFSREITAIYPIGIPRSTYDTKYTTFKQQYMVFLSERIGRLFYEHYKVDDLPDVN